MQRHPSANQIASPGSSRFFLLVAIQDDPLSSIVRARVASQCLNLHTRSDWMTDPSLPKKLNIFQLSVTVANAPTERTDPQCIARPSPFKVNGDQSTDGGSGHEATPRAHCTVSQRTWEGVADGWGSSLCRGIRQPIKSLRRVLHASSCLLRCKMTRFPAFQYR